MGDDNTHCDPQCPFLAPSVEKYEGLCRRDGQPLHYYDFYIAHCQADPQA